MISVGGLKCLLGTKPPGSCQGVAGPCASLWSALPRIVLHCRRLDLGSELFTGHLSRSFEVGAPSDIYMNSLIEGIAREVAVGFGGHVDASQPLATHHLRPYFSLRCVRDSVWSKASVVRSTDGFCVHISVTSLLGFRVCAFKHESVACACKCLPALAIVSELLSGRASRN